MLANSPATATATETASPTPAPTETPEPTATPAPRPTYDLLGPARSFVPAAPLPDPLPAGWPTDLSDRVVTRVVVRDLRIDLPVIEPHDEVYPLCDVAMFFVKLGQPGGGQAVYLYAHAREGMFLPILDASKIDDGEKMLGMIVDIYTSDDLIFRYRIMEVRRHQLSIGDAFADPDETLWLQTSEGPKGTPGKTQVIAKPFAMAKAQGNEAHPQPRPRVCE